MNDYAVKGWDQTRGTLVFDGDEAVAWCQHSSPSELPNIYHRKALLDHLRDYRITCIFVDKKCRRRGMVAVALRGALDLIAQADGGVAEGLPARQRGQSSTAACEKPSTAGSARILGMIGLGRPPRPQLGGVE
jgi:hypothetical protein